MRAFERFGEEKGVCSGLIGGGAYRHLRNGPEGAAGELSSPALFPFPTPQVRRIA